MTGEMHFIDTPDEYKVGEYRFGRAKEDPETWVMFDKYNRKRGTYSFGWMARQHAVLLTEHGDVVPG